jgi:ATP-dependent RNA helicase RhlE
MSFQELRLSEPIVRAVAGEGYTAPTPIQAKAIPVALAGRDVLGCAQTGTGKTCAFALPILHLLAERQAGSGPHARKGPAGRAPRALILAPTRELASQIFDSFVAYGRHLSLRHTVVYGGVGQGKQVQAMKAGVDVLIATPGRLLDLINQGYIDLRKIEILVLDEADRMLDMGFINDIRKVVAMVPAERQTLFFSATVSPEIRRLADAMLRDPVSVETAPEATTVEAVTQTVYLVERANKTRVLQSLLERSGVGRTLVFTRTKHGADRLVKMLHKAEIRAEAIHGNKSQSQRTRALAGFKNGRTPILVATDIASRGIDVDEITHVVNYDMPVDAETYVHRIGRTARAGATGAAISLCDRDEVKILREIERRTRGRLAMGEDLPELTMDPRSIAVEHPTAKKPAHRGGGGGRGKPGAGRSRSRSRSRGGPRGRAASAS